MPAQTAWAWVYRSHAPLRLVRNAVVVESHADTKRGNVFVSAIYRLYAPVQIDGSMYRVKLTVKDLTAPDNPAKLLHALEAVEIENAPLGTFPASSATNASVQQGQPTTGRWISIRQLMTGAQLQNGTPVAE